MADIEQPIDAGRITHLYVMHRTEDDDGDPIPADYLLASDGALGHTWRDPATVGDTTALDAAVFGYLAHGNTGASEDFDVSAAGWHSATLNAATVTVTLSGATSGEAANLLLELAQDGTGGRVIDLPASVANAAELEAAQDTTAGATSFLLLISRDGGTTWYGFWAGGSSVELSDDDPLPVGTADPGVGTTASRDDHVHGITAAVVQSVGHYEILMASGSADPLLTSDGLDYLYVWVT